MLKLIDYISEEKLDDMLNQLCCELEYDDLCFEKVYKVVSDIVPKDKIIIDIGCYMAAQAYYFLDNPLYIGVDCYDESRMAKLQLLKEKNIDISDYKKMLDLGIFYLPPMRFTTNNSIHVISEASIWIKEKGWEKILGNNIDLNKTYVVCSGVADKKVLDFISNSFPNYVIYYPGCEIISNGISADLIKNEIEKSDDSFLDNGIVMVKNSKLHRVVGILKKNR